MQDHPPVAQLVAEPFDDQCGVTGHHRGGVTLIGEQSPEILGGKCIESDLCAARVEGGANKAGKLRGEPADGRAQFGRPTGGIAAPERQPGRCAGRRNDQHPIVGDLGDTPTGCPEGDHVAGPRFVDHLLVEFTDPRGLLAHHVHREHSAIGNRPAGCDREALGTGATGQGSGVSVIDQPRPKFGEIR